MIWVFLRRLMLWVRRSFALPETRDLVRLDAHSPCPVCNARTGTLRAVHRQNAVLAQRTCGLCGARWHLKPVLETMKPEHVWPSVLRTELERREEISLPKVELKVTGPGIAAN